MLRIAGGLVLPDAAADAARRDVLVAEGRVRRLLDPDEPCAEDAVAARIDVSGSIIIPGLVNAHVHSSGNLVRSLSDRWNLELQLNAGPAFRGEQSDREKYLTALIGAVEMISRGCTACYDIFYEAPLPSPGGFGAVAQAYRDIGMRAVIAPMVSDVSYYDAVPGLFAALPEEHKARLRARAGPSSQAILAAMEAVAAAWPRGQTSVLFAVAPTIPMHCTDGFLREAASFARANGFGFHTHFAESKVQAVYARDRYGTSIAAHLKSLGVLSERFTAAHAVWVDDEEIRILAGEGCSVAHAPGANMRLGVGVAHVRAMLAAGITVGLATDSRVCSDNLNMFEATRLASYASRIHGYDRKNWLSAREAFRLATEGGARALGLEGRIGRIAPGHAADLVFLDRWSTNYVPLVDLVHQLVHAEDATAVTDVMIDGRFVYRDRRFLHLDLPSLLAEAEEASLRLVTTNAPAVAASEELEEHVLAVCGCLAHRRLGIDRFVGKGLVCQ